MRKLVSQFSLEFVQQSLPEEAYVREPHLRTFPGYRKAAPIFPAIKVVQEKALFLEERGRPDSITQINALAVEPGNPILVVTLDSKDFGRACREGLPMLFAAAAYDTKELNEEGRQLREKFVPDLMGNPHVEARIYV